MAYIIWRGAGVMVPITIVISSWLTGYWYEDESFFNDSFMSWMLLWSGIFLTLLGLGLFPFKKDPETQQRKYVGGNDFMFVPLIVWGIGILGYSVFLFNKPEPIDKYKELREEIANLENPSDLPYDEYLNSVDSHQMPSGLTYYKNMTGLKEGQRYVCFFNPKKDSVQFSFKLKGDSEDNAFKQSAAPEAVIGAVVKSGTYILSYNGVQLEVNITPSKTRESYDWDDAWFILGEGTEFLLVDVSEVCHDSLSVESLRLINWEEKVKERYAQTNPIEVNVKREFEKLIFIRHPYYSLPVQRDKTEQIYTLIPIPSSKEVSDEYLDNFMENLCFKED